MKDNNQTPQQLLRATDIALQLNISKAMAYRLMQQGKIRAVHISGSRRVRPKDLQLYIEQNLTLSH